MARPTLAARLGALDATGFRMEAPMPATTAPVTPAQALQQCTRVPNWFYVCDHPSCTNRYPASWRTPLGLVLCDFDAWAWANAYVGRARTTVAARD